jgi:hypothetical protein
MRQCLPYLQRSIIIVNYACLFSATSAQNNTKPALSVVSSSTLASSKFIDPDIANQSSLDSSEAATCNTPVSLFCRTQRDKAAHAHAYPSRHTDTHERGHSSGREVVTIGHRDSHISRWRLIHSQHVTAGLTIQKTPRTASPPHRTLETPIKTAGDPAVPAPVQFSNYHTLPTHLTATTSTTNQALLNTTNPIQAEELRRA